MGAKQGEVSMPSREASCGPDHEEQDHTAPGVRSRLRDTRWAPRSPGVQGSQCVPPSSQQNREGLESWETTVRISNQLFTEQ